MRDLGFVVVCAFGGESWRLVLVDWTHLAYSSSIDLRVHYLSRRRVIDHGGAFIVEQVCILSLSFGFLSSSFTVHVRLSSYVCLILAISLGKDDKILIHSLVILSRCHRVFVHLYLMQFLGFVKPVFVAQLRLRLVQLVYLDHVIDHVGISGDSSTHRKLPIPRLLHYGSILYLYLLAHQHLRALCVHGSLAVLKIFLDTSFLVSKGLLCFQGTVSDWALAFRWLLGFLIGEGITRALHDISILLLLSLNIFDLLGL